MDKIKESTVQAALNDYPTPFYLYQEAGIIAAAQTVNSAFSWNADFKNFFAVKALPNPKILKLLLDQGMGLDCSSMTELLLAEKVGARGSQIMFSSSDTPAEDFVKARQLGSIINLDDLSHLDFLEQAAGLPDLICFRYNPGDLVQGNDIIGQPKEAKFGMTKQQIIDGIKLAQQKGVRQFGLHTMVISNNLDVQVGLQIVKVLFELAAELRLATGVQLEFINLGGGIGITYQPSQTEFDVKLFSYGVRELSQSLLNYQPAIYMECGRYITGPYGYLVSRVLHIKRTYKTFIGLDASMHNLMRPGMYGAYHHITILGKSADETQPPLTYDVTGSLCENNDKFAVDRRLPKVEIGDIFLIHDAGAHGHAMGSNYNGKLRSAELLLRSDGRTELIRRAETNADYFSTLV